MKNLLNITPNKKHKIYYNYYFNDILHIEVYRYYYLPHSSIYKLYYS